jgi:hypothetical protein
VTEATLEFENIVYVEPQCLRNPIYNRDMRSDIYSLGILLWELTSGRPPFSNYVHDLAQITNQLLSGLREDQIEYTPLEYVQLYQECWQDDPNGRPEIGKVFKILSQLLSQFDTNEQYTRLMYGKSISDDNSYMELDHKEMSDQSLRTVAEIFGSSLSKQQVIRQFKLNHGINLTGGNMRLSEHAIIDENGELNVDVYKGQPLIYTYTNSGDNDKSLDICINFPIAEMIYNGNLLESFSNNMDVDEGLHELYDHFIARKFSVGNQLFIKDFHLATTTQIDILKFYLFHIYYLTKCSTEIQLDELFTLNLIPKIVTSDGELLDTHEKVVKWMNELHQKRIIDIISCDTLTPLQHSTSSIDDLETFNEIQLGITGFKEKLNLEEWVGDAMHNNLISLVKDFKLFQGLIVNKNYKIENSKKINCKFIKIPEINLINKSHLDIIKPITKLEQRLMSNNIFSINNLSTFPFIKINDKSYEGYSHVLVVCEKYEILLDMDNIKPTKEFEQAIEEALNCMNPLKALQNVFNEYGHLFPQKIILGRSLNNVLRDLSSPNTFDNVNDDNHKILESLDNLNISYLLTQEGRIIEKNDMHNWIRNTNNHLEVVKFDNIIPLYKILETEQQGKIDDILKNNFKILMTGITDLTDLNNNDVENYKRIEFGLSVGSEDYEVFGLIISENNAKLEEIYVNFGLYDFKGFYAIIKREETSINIKKCFISWIVIGKPSRFSVFSPNNRDLEVNYINKSIKFQPDKLNYTIDTSFTLHEGYTVFAHVNYSSMNLEPNYIIKLVEWKERFIGVQIKSTYRTQSNAINSSFLNNDFDHEDKDCLENEIDLRICILSTNYKCLKVDNAKERECSLDLMGYILNKENFEENLFNESETNEVSNDIQNDDSTTYQLVHHFQQELEGILINFYFTINLY